MDEFYRLPMQMPMHGTVYPSTTQQMPAHQMPTQQMPMTGAYQGQLPSTMQHTMPMMPHTDDLQSTVHAQFHQPPGIGRLEREIQALQRQVNALDRRVDRLERRIGHY